MFWNEIDYDMQKEILNKISGLISVESDVNVKQALMSARHELDLWSNRPCSEAIPDPQSNYFCSIEKDYYYQQSIINSLSVEGLSE